MRRPLFGKGNYLDTQSVYCKVQKRVLWAIPVAIAAALGAASSEYISARHKLDSIESGGLRPGSRVEFSTQELDAYVAQEAPAGVRNPKIQLVAREVAAGTALVDFGRVERAQGYKPGWLMSKLLDGERPVSVTARIRSSAGHATVDVQRVEISGIAIDGRTLDFLIQNFLLPLYPNAVVGKPFELGNRIERLDVGPGSVGVVIGR